MLNNFLKIIMEVFTVTDITHWSSAKVLIHYSCKICLLVLYTKCNNYYGMEVVKNIKLVIFDPNQSYVNMWHFYQLYVNNSWRQHPTRHQLYGHLPPIMKTIQVRWRRHTGHCWRSKDKLISDVLLWTPTYGQARAGRPARTYIQQLCEDTGCSPEDLPEAMNDREKWWERVRDICASGTTWWWWWWCQNINIKIKEL